MYQWEQIEIGRLRTWLERTKAKQSLAVSISLWATLLLILVTVILLRGPLAP